MSRTFFSLLLVLSVLFSALIAKRIAEKKEKAAAIKASHKKWVSLSEYCKFRQADVFTFRTV